MHEIINIQVGSCGNKLSTNFWTSILQEHGIQPDGSANEATDLQLEKINSYFHQPKENQYFPRATLIDLEPTSIDDIRGSSLGRLFGPDTAVVGRGGTGNNWAKGFYSQGEEWIEFALDSIRQHAEQCDRLQGFQMVHSLGGGTGSGMGCLVASRLKEEYPDCMIQSFPVFPSGKVSDIVVEPYNAVLALKKLMEYADIIQVMDNEALYDICFRSLKMTSPTYQDLNRLMGEAMAALTCTYRFPEELQSTMRKTATNLIPFPGVPFLMSTFSEIAQTGSTDVSHFSIQHVTQRAFDAKSSICGADIRHGRFLSASMVYRGRTSSKQVDDAILSILNKSCSYVVEWIPNNLKGCLCEAPRSTKWRLSCVLNGNSTAIQEVLKRTSESFHAMFRRKAFVHWYTEAGMDEMEFVNAEAGLQDVISEYQRLQDATAEEEEEYYDEEEEWEQA